MTLMTSGEITEGLTVTLHCSSDANPAAKYTWKKKNNETVLGEDQQYYCTAKNELGETTSESVSVDVKCE